MVKMSWAVDLEAQQIYGLNEHFLVGDRIRKAGRSTHQGNGWLKNKLLNPNGGNIPTPPLPISSERNVLTKQSVGPHVQNDRDTRFRTCIPSPESPPPKNPDHGSKVPVVLATLKGSARQLLPGRTDEAT
jgi:hypothetical protein